MNILVLGSGGREHALCWRLSQDSSSSKIFAWPGNAGFNHIEKENGQKIICINPVFNKHNLKEIIELNRIDLVIPGAEKFLYEGVSDWCDEWRVNCFGPTAKAATLEKSKLFSKKVMLEAGIPTAAFQDLTHTFNQNLSKTKEILKNFKKPVIKISGPSLGKGVFVCKSIDEAYSVLEEIKSSPLAGIEEGIFVEEALEGNEISLFYACNGLDFAYLGAAQDHKRLLDADEGPNTGGMGAVSPVSWADDLFIQNATRIFLEPTLKEMSRIGAPFKGVLFLGLMVNEKGAGLLEYNVRFGDPETQVILPLIEGDFSKLLFNFAKGKKERINKINIKNAVAVHIVKAARGYPGTFGTTVEKGQPILENCIQSENAQFFFAGVRKEKDGLFTDGGRVLGITSVGKDKECARKIAYQKISELKFVGEQYRRDIGEKA